MPRARQGPEQFLCNGVERSGVQGRLEQAASRADLRDGVNRPGIRRRRCRFYGVSLKNVHHEHRSRHHQYRLHCGEQPFQELVGKKVALSIKARSPWSANFSKKEMSLQKGKFAAGDSWPRKVTFPQIISSPRRVKVLRTTSLPRRRILQEGKFAEEGNYAEDGDFTNWVGFAKDGTPPRTAGCQKHFLRRMGTLLNHLHHGKRLCHKGSPAKKGHSAEGDKYAPVFGGSAIREPGKPERPARTPKNRTHCEAGSQTLQLRQQSQAEDLGLGLS